MNKKYQLPLFVVLLGFGYSGYLFYAFSSEDLPRLETNLRNQESTLVTKNGELKRLRHFSENIEATKLTLRELNLQLETLLETVPRTYDLSGLLRKLSVIGFNSGIQLSSFRPSTAVAKEGEYFEATQISFVMGGSFTEIMSFFDQALRLKRIIRIDRVTMHVASGSQVAKNAGVAITADVSAKLYRFMD